MKSSAVYITPIPTDHANSYWLGEPDANGQVPERHTSDGKGIPCRHCLESVIAGESYLILSYRPFVEMQPYAECGPIFLHAEPCPAYQDGANIPEMFLSGAPRIMKAYDKSNRIIYGSGKVVEPGDIITYARELLYEAKVAYIHVRSSENNCFTFRIDRENSDDKE